MPTVAVIGASGNRSKFGNKAVRAFALRGYEVFPINPHESVVEGHTAYPTVADIPVRELDLVTFYVPPDVGIALLPDVARKRPKEVFLNPGSANPALVARAEQLGLNIVQACSILAVGVSPHDL